MQYSVRLKNISDNDQLVLRLIFSLSARARGRTHAYCLAESEDDKHADICIAQFNNSTLEQAHSNNDIILLENTDEPSTVADYSIRKPLIASRVLTLLDRFLSERQTQTASSQTETTLPDAPQTTVPESNTQTDPAEMEFCITEEEASELAIVDDESLANPSNLQTITHADVSATENTAPAVIADKVTSLVVRHNNTEREVSTQAFETRAPDVPQSRPRALVVDDSPSVRKQIELELELFNVDVDFAESVASAQAQQDKQHYDVAFLDVVLPDGNGFDICRSVKDKNKLTKVIMLTGKATAADKIRGTMAGCDAYLVKPVGRMTFQNTVCNYLQLREQLEVIHA